MSEERTQEEVIVIVCINEDQYLIGALEEKDDLIILYKPLHLHYNSSKQDGLSFETMLPFIDSSSAIIIPRSKAVICAPTAEVVEFYLSNRDQLIPTVEQGMPMVNTKVENGEVVFDDPADYDNWLLLVAAEPSGTIH